MPALKLSVFVITICTIIIACNNGANNVPFPEEYNYVKPLTQALEFSPEKKLQWSIMSGTVKPGIKSLDINALPSVSYDSNGFIAMKAKPVMVKITPLSNSKLVLKDSAQKLFLKTSILTQPSVSKSARIASKSGTSMELYDFNESQGYAGKLTTCFLKDHDELLWIGSDAGLYCYDGEYIRKYDVGGITDVIVGLAEDKSGRIWVVSSNGLTIIDRKKSIVSKSDQIIPAGSSLSTIMIDHSNNLVISNLKDSGFCVINPLDLTFKHITKNNGLIDNRVNNVTEDKNNNYWVPTANGIDIIEPNGNIQHLKKENGLGIFPYAPLLQDSNNVLWCFQQGQLEKIDMQNNTITHFAGMPGNAFAFELLKDEMGRIWVTTTVGVFIIDTADNTYKLLDAARGVKDNVCVNMYRGGNGKLWISTLKGITIIGQDGNMVHPLSVKQVSSSFQQANGKIWIGGFGSGIEIVDRKKNTVTRITTANGLSSDIIQAFRQEGNSVWVTTNEGLDILNTSNKTITHIGKNEGLANSIVYNALKSSTGDIWLVGPQSGIDVIDSSLTTIKHLGLKEGLSDSNVVDIKIDIKGKIWLATASGGVAVIDPARQTIKNIINVKALKGTSNKILFSDAYNRMWIATKSGICIADDAIQTVTTLTKAQGLNSNNITSFSAYKNSVVVGTNSKANIIIPPARDADTSVKWQVSTLQNSDILVKQNNSWSTDLVTNEGEFWWCDNGVTIVNNIKPAKSNAKTFETGFTIMNQPGEFISDIQLNDKDTLWAEDTFYVKGNLLPVKATTSKLKYFWDSVEGPYNMPVNLRVPYNQNYLQFQFSQVSSGRRDTVWYSYMLDGIDKQWGPLTTKSVSENYLNLPPGTYIFKVKSKELSGEWNSAPDFKFTILPPWWKTWWFYTLVVILFAALLRGYISFRSRKLKKENKLLEDKISLRTMQLQKSIDDLKAAQAQLVHSEKMASLGELTAGIAHEIQNPLNFVNNFSEVNSELIEEVKDEIDKGNYEEAKLIANDIITNEQKINYHGKRADAIVKGMLQHSRQSSGKKETSDINALCDEYLRLSYHGLRAKDKNFNSDFKTEFDNSIGKINIVPQDIGRVLLNIINNAFYAVNEKQKAEGESYKPLVSVITRKINNPNNHAATGTPSGDGGIEVKIADNGKGIPQDIIDKIFQPFFTTKPTGQGTGLGLSLAYDIITKEHNGTIKVESKAEEGSAFIIQLPA